MEHNQAMSTSKDEWDEIFVGRKIDENNIISSKKNMN